MERNIAPIFQSLAAAQAANSSLTFTLSGTALYGLVPSFYCYFYEREILRWLRWYDGFVPEVHGVAKGIISTNIAKTIVDRSMDAVFTGGVMFGNADKPKIVDENGVSLSLCAISDRWSKEVDFESHLRQVCKYAASGGTGLLKLNQGARGRLWLDTYRADRFFAVLDTSGRVESVKAVLTIYQGGGEQSAAFAIVEERYYRDLKWSRRVPVQRFSVYRVPTSTTQVTLSQRVMWKDLPHPMKDYLRTEYASIRIDEEQMLPFASLGCYAFRYTDGCDRYNGVEMGDSMIQPIMQYLLGYDYYFSAMMTDMYIGRGRVIAKKALKSPGADKGGNHFNEGLDGFLFEQIPSISVEEQKPTPIQFDLRSADWREIRNIFMESIAFTIGMSVGTLASFLGDASNRTAREISAEENATARFVEARRHQFEKPANECLRDVCTYFGFVDIVSVRWSLAGQTNIDTLSQRMVTEVQAGVRSLQSAVQSINPDMDDHQVQEEIARIDQDQGKKNAALFGDIGGATDII